MFWIQEIFSFLPPICNNISGTVRPFIKPIRQLQLLFWPYLRDSTVQPKYSLSFIICVCSRPKQWPMNPSQYSSTSVRLASPPNGYVLIFVHNLFLYLNLDLRCENSVFFWLVERLMCTVNDFFCVLSNKGFFFREY